MTAGGAGFAPSALNTTSIWVNNRMRLSREALEYVASVPQRPAAVDDLVSTIRRAAASRAYSVPLIAFIVVGIVIATPYYAAKILPDFGVGRWGSIAAIVIGAPMRRLSSVSADGRRELYVIGSSS